MPRVRKSKKKIECRELTDSSALMVRIHQSDTLSYVVLSWRLPDYDKLEENVMYYESYQSAQVCCTFRILMRSSALYLCVVGETIPLGAKAEFTVMGEPSLRCMVMKADKVDSRIFMADFPRKGTFDRCLDNLLRNDSILTVSFKYESDVQVLYKTRHVEATELLGDLSGFCCDLKKMYYENLHSDFVILNKQIGFRVHKYVLAGRSLFFRERLLQNRNLCFYELEDFPFPGIVHEFLVYLYSGELRDMDATCMIWMYDLASRFRVTPLFERCCDYFRANLDAENCKTVALFAKFRGYADLKNIVAKFQVTLFPDVNIVQYFKDIEREFLEESAQKSAKCCEGAL